MLYRLFVVCLALGCITTFIALQQSPKLQNRLQYDSFLSSDGYYHFSKMQNKKGAFYETDRVPKVKASIARQKLLDNYHSELYVSETFVQARKRMDRFNNGNRSGSYLVPILYNNMGPNNLFRIFKESVVASYYLKRTLVVPPFHHHPKMKTKQEEKRRKSVRIVDVDIFDQSFSSALESDPENVVDITSLNQLIPAVSMSKFHTDCGQHLDALIMCGEFGEKHKLGLEQFKAIVNISVSNAYPVEDINKLLEYEKNKQDLWGVAQLTKEKQCLGLALGNKCLGSRKAWFEKWKTFSTFVRRPAAVKVLAKQFVAAVFKGEPFLAVHWRYDNEDWQDMCKPSRPRTVRRVNEPLCDIATKFVDNSSFRLFLANRLKIYADLHDLKYIYFAAPPQLSSSTHDLQLKVNGLHILSDVRAFAQNNHLMDELFDNNFSTSFIEQELCYLAKTFLGSPLSSWTQNVMQDRFSEDRANHTSIFSVIVPDQNIFPTMRWLFPEGD